MSSFSAHKLSNPLFLGLKGDFYVVVNPDIRGEVVDLVSAEEMDVVKATAQTLVEAFEGAADHMPYERTPEGGFRIDYSHNSGLSAMHVPKSENDERFHQTYNEWLCWRARIDLWVSRNGPVLSQSQKDQVLHLLDQQAEKETRGASVRQDRVPALAVM